MRRITRWSAAGASLAGVLTLAACQKPAPELTIQTGSVSKTVSATSYSWDSGNLRAFKPDLPEITADTGRTVLIDVPRRVAHNGWSVTAISLSDTKKAIGQSGEIQDSHTYRVAAQSNNGQPFIVRVDEYRDGKPNGSVWSFLVKVDDGTA